MGKVRELHFQDGTTNRFWRITVDDKTYTVQFGRRGTTGQTQTKELGSATAAKTAADKLIAEKVGRGTGRLR